MSRRHMHGMSGAEELTRFIEMNNSERNKIFLGISVKIHSVLKNENNFLRVVPVLALENRLEERSRN